MNPIDRNKIWKMVGILALITVVAGGLLRVSQHSSYTLGAVSYTHLDVYKRQNKRFVDVTLDDFQYIADNSGKNFPTLRKYKVLVGLMCKWAVIHDIIPPDRNKAAYIDIKKAGNPNSYDRQPFSRKEIEKLWKWKDTNEYFKVILMLIYSGVRISELLDLKKENVNLSERWFDVTASKTQAGIRKVPINIKVLPYFEEWYNKNDCEYLISTPEGKHFDYRCV